jgi:hypothetical protein
MTESPESRTALLAERVDAAVASHAPTFQVPYRQRQIDLHKIEVPIDFPFYRLLNGRTHRAQAQYIETHGLSADFFEDPENPEAQRAQGEILLDMASLSDLDQDLSENPQREPLILTPDGFIVNGNRRTAWLRNEGSHENLTAVVLPPDAGAPDIYDTEVELQMARETKAAYNWIDQALHVRLGVEKLYQTRPPDDTIRSIARRMNSGEAEVKAIIERLALVDLYLEWLDEPGAYHHIGEPQSDGFQAFEELRERVRRQQFRSLPEIHQRTILNACFAALKESGEYMDIRRVFNAMRQQPQEVVNRVRPELTARSPELAERLDQPVAPDPPGNNGGGEGDDDLLAQLAGAQEGHAPPPGVELLNLVGGAEHAPVVGPILVDVARELEDERKEAQQRLAALRQVEKAFRALQGVDLDEDTPALPDIAQKLAEVIAQAEELAEQVEDLRNGI